MALAICLSIVLLLTCCSAAQATDCPFPCACTLQTVDCSGRGLLDVPSFIPADTQVLDLSNNELSSIGNESLNVLTQLRTLDLSRNRISEIGHGALLGLAKLETLNLDGNKIEHFVKANLSSLSNLRALRLDRNRILDLECDQLKHLHNLTELHVGYNKLTVFPDYCFDQLAKLRFLDLSWNRFHLICEHTFLGLVSLETLLLNNNHLHHAISDHAFEALGNLRALDLTKAHVFGLTNKTFLGLKSVVALNLSDNAIKDISHGVFSALVNMETLQLSRNPITLVPDNAFLHNTQLKQLRLNSMRQLLFFYPKAFAGLSNLVRLEARGNTKMEVLHRDVLAPLKRVEVLDFRNGGIQSLHSSVVRNITSQPQFFLSGNPLKCSCALTWMKLIYSNGSASTFNITDLHVLQCESPPNLHGMKLIDVPTANLTCAKAKIANHSEVVRCLIGTSVELVCPVEGEPRPSIRWATPGGRNFTYIQYDPYSYWPDEVIMAEHVKNGSYHAAHHWHESNKYYTSFDESTRIHLLDNGNLYIDYVVRGDAGSYSCYAENSGGNDSTVIRLHLDYFVIRKVRDFTCFVGGACAAGLLLIAIVFASIRACVYKCMQTCCKREKKERKGLREILDNLGTYRTERLQTLKDNYHLHIDRVKDQCSENLGRLRENYHTQIGKIRENCASRIERVRINYADQKGKIKGFGSNKVEKIRDNYNSQMLKIREYGHNQLKKIHENYKLQQQHILKILEMLNIENCKGVVDAECLRTESMLFDAQLLIDPDATDTPEAMTPDNRSESDYMTAGSVSEIGSLNEPTDEDARTIVDETVGDSNDGFEKDETEGTALQPFFNLGERGDDASGEQMNRETSM